MKVFVAAYEDRRGNLTLRAFKDFQGAQAWKDEIGKENWSRVSDDPLPEDPCGDEYFDLVQYPHGEAFNWDERPIE